jgi:energy-coupling factor transporter ATP-binding protein EcfA2
MGDIVTGRGTLYVCHSYGDMRPSFRVLAVFVIAVALRVNAAQRPPQPVIEKVTPTSAPIGAKVTLVMNMNVEGAIVLFGGTRADAEFPAGDLLYVAVPEDLVPGETPPITVRTHNGSATWFGFKVEPPVSLSVGKATAPLRIRSVLTSGDPVPGELVSVRLTRALNLDDPWTVYVGDEKADAAATANGELLEVVIPKNIAPGFRSIYVVEGKAATAPFLFEVGEKRYLGIPKSLLGWVVASLFIVFTVGGTTYRQLREKRRYSRLEQQFDVIRDSYVENAAVSSLVAVARPMERGESPAVPRELAEICSSGNCLLFAGPGLGAQSRLPTRYEALTYLIRNSDLDDVMREQLLEALDGGQLGFVTEILSGRVPRETLTTALQFLYSPDNAEISDAHRLLARMPFAGALTTGWDGLIEKMFEREKPLMLTGESDMSTMTQDDRFYIARLYGDLFDRESFIFTSEEYQRTLYVRPLFARFVASQVLNRPIFFVGMSLGGIEEFFDAFRFPIRAEGVKNYALVPSTRLREVQQERFRTKYGVELIFYPVTRGHAELPEFIRKLEKEAGPIAAALPKSKEALMSSAKLRRIELTNIGAFDTLVLDDLQDGWNVVLGNNGAGKSTILKAIALGICGDSPEAAIGADRLLRSGARNGKIQLLIGDMTYVTELYRDGERVDVRCELETPLRRGKWVVLGFPPLRGVSTRDSSGATGVTSAPPRVADLLPIIRGTTDTRLDSLKDWLVNLWVSARLTEIPQAEAQRYQRTLDAFYALLRLFTPGQKISAGRVERMKNGWQVFVTTDDGEIPIDNVSQGMSSIFGWVGTLLQRMNEIYGDQDEPMSESALVLVDEIDAHLHPEWQQKLTSIVKEYLPNVQIIATTHSPLLVAGMSQKELYIARRETRDSSRINVFRSPIDPEGLRADQVLTSPLFGLQSSRSPKVNEKIDRYVSLLGKRSRQADEETEFLALRQQLSSMLLYGESEIERTAELRAARDSERKTTDLAAQIAAASQEIKDKLKQEIL